MLLTFRFKSERSAAFPWETENERVNQSGKTRLEVSRFNRQPRVPFKKMS